MCLKMREDNAGDTPGGRTSSDLETPAATQFDKKGNVSIVINSGVKRRSKKWSQRKDTDVVGMTMRRNFIYGGENGVGGWKRMLVDSGDSEPGRGLLYLLY